MSDNIQINTTGRLTPWKVIPNSRRNTGKKKGGQPGHEKHILTPPEASTVTNVVEHTGDDGFVCPDCGSENFAPTGESEIKYEYDIEVKVVRREHVYYYYRCLDCGTQFRSVIEPRLKEKCQYGSMVQAVELSLLDTVNAPVNKTGMFLAGLTAGGLAPCDGYISKLQNRAGQALVRFCGDLRLLMLTRTLLYWDDTVIMIHTARACFRFMETKRLFIMLPISTKIWKAWTMTASSVILQQTQKSCTTIIR